MEPPMDGAGYSSIDGSMLQYDVLPTTRTSCTKVSWTAAAINRLGIFMYKIVVFLRNRSVEKEAQNRHYFSVFGSFLMEKPL